MPKILEVYSSAIKECKAKGVLSSDIRLLISYDMGYSSPIECLYHKDEEFTANEKFEAQFARLCNGEPVEYIINQVTFLEYKLFVDSRVLIPRMETQELIANISEKIYDYFDPRNYLVVADIGTGSGAISIALKGLFKNWLITASDISKDALEVAKKNIDGTDFSISLKEGKSLEPFIKDNAKLDIIVSNPPYITSIDETQPSVKDYEPSNALFLDKSNSVYEDILRDCYKVKKGSLLICFEIGYDLVPYLQELMGKYLTNYKFEFIKDLNGFDRFLFIFLE